VGVGVDVGSESQKQNLAIEEALSKVTFMIMFQGSYFLIALTHHTQQN